MSTTGKEYKLAIRIAGIIDKSFSTSLATANSAMKTTVANIDKDFVKLDKGYDKIMKAGKKCFDAIATAAGVATVAIAAATAASISVGTEFETAFAGVKKTVEATEEEYAKLRQDILDMTREIPSAGTEIAGVMEVAGQLGVAKESLSGFTQTMIQLGVAASDLEAEDAATSLARFTNIMTMSDYDESGVSNFQRLGSVITDLGNKTATTEGEIIDIATALAAAGKIANMSESDIMGISAAMSSVGLTSESGASAMSRLIMQMQQSISEGGEMLSQYAEVSGMDVDTFTALFRSNAANAVVKFIEGLNAAGEDSYGILEDLELSTIRTRKAFLSLANADQLMTNTMEIAGKAWDENTALADEYAKKCETTESHIRIMKNAFEELGIVAYDDLRDPFNDVIGFITDKVHGLTDYVGGADGISKWMKNIGTEIPTLQRKVKQYGEPVLEFFDPLLDIGKWFLKNPKVIVGTLTAIGSALATYKTASSLHSVVKSLSGLSPGGVAVTGAVAGIGLLVGAYTIYKQKEQEMIDQSLAEHFGNIALSMEELQAVAEHIISTDSLGGVKQALEAFEDLDGIAATMKESISEINKMNWKVSIGMELTEDDQESYKAAIESYVAAAQEYALQSRYAVYLNLATTLDENDLESSNIVDKINGFYESKYDELSALGTRLNEAVTEAFTDGLLEFDEMEEIADIQAQMAAIEEALATGEFDAQMSLLGMDFKGSDLSADSFMNLQTELSKQVEDATAAYRESYVKNISAAQAAYEGGAITIDEYYSEIARYEEQYLSNIGSLQEKAASFQLDTLLDVYGAGIEEIYAKYEGLNGVDLYEAIMGDEDFDSTRGAIRELLDLMEPTIAQMGDLAQRYEAAGETVPAAIQQIIDKYAILNSIAGKGTQFGLSDLPGDNYIPFGEYAGMDKAMDYFEQSGNIFGELNTTIINEAAEAAGLLVYDLEQDVVDPTCSKVYDATQTSLDSYFANGFFVDSDLNILLDPSVGFMASIGEKIKNAAIESSFINHRATGGLATSPELTWFAENGPEMAIPIDGSRNAISLWEQTGRLLGMDSVIDGLDVSGSTGPTIEYSPTLQFYGAAPSKEDLTDALRVSQDEFEALMERYMRTHSRVSFG